MYVVLLYDFCETLFIILLLVPTNNTNNIYLNIIRFSPFLESTRCTGIGSWQSSLGSRRFARSAKTSCGALANKVIAAWSARPLYTSDAMTSCWESAPAPRHNPTLRW